MIINGYDWRDKKVLVTGASGFKGSWLCSVLKEMGCRVYGTVRDQVHPESAYNIMGLDTVISKVSGDITDRQQVYDMINSVEPDVIFHLAAKALVPVSLRDPRRTFDVNIMGTLNIIEACRKLRVCEKILICSTDHVFGSIKPEELPKGGFPEESHVSYGGPYDTSKAAMELLVRSYHATYWSEVPAIGISRCANVFGYGDVNQRRVLPLFLSAAGKGSPISLKYRKNGRQFIHIADTITGYIRAASSLNEGSTIVKQQKEKPVRSPFTQTFHFAIEKYDNTDDPFIRMGDLAHTIAKMYHVDIKDHDAVDYAANENNIQALNCQQTIIETGWKTRKAFSEALNELGKWYSGKWNSSDQKKAIWKDVVFITDGLN